MKAIDDLMSFKRYLRDRGFKMPESMAISEDKMNTIYCEIICKYFPMTYITDRIDIRLSVCNEFFKKMELPIIVLLQ